MASRYSRRTFLFQGATTAGMASLGLSAAGRKSFAQSPSEHIRIGMIGLGWRGGQLLEQLGKHHEAEVVALCDPDEKLLAEASKRQPGAKTYSDLRKLLEDRSIDAVVIATCNHWHCLAAVWACEAGKDVYVEKPLSFRLWEGRQLVNAAHMHSRIVQVGMQQRSDPMQDRIRAYLHEEQGLGAIQSVVVTRFGVRESIGKRSTPLVPPKSLDYNLWLGPARDEPIYRNKLDYDWHWDWNTGNGECANWGVHIIDDVRNVVFHDAAMLPTRVACGGGRLVWNDAGETPNMQFAYLEAGGLPVYVALSNLPEKPESKRPLRFVGVESGYIVKCEGGSYHGSRGQGVAFDLQGERIKSFRGDSGGGHFKNFFQAVRERDPAKLKAAVAVGHDSTNWSHVINAAWLAGKHPGLIPDWNTSIAAASNTSAVAEELAELMRDQLQAFYPEGEASGVRMSGVLSIDPERERFVGEGAAAANEFLGPRSEYRAPFLFKPVAAS